mgnify:FL=1
MDSRKKEITVLLTSTAVTVYPLGLIKSIAFTLGL